MAKVRDMVRGLELGLGTSHHVTEMSPECNPRKHRLTLGFDSEYHTVSDFVSESDITQHELWAMVTVSGLNFELS